MACGKFASITEATLASYDYAAFTGQASSDDGAPPLLRLLPAAERLSARALADLVAGGGRMPVVLDVRPPEQFAIGHLEGADTSSRRSFDRCLMPGLLQSRIVTLHKDSYSECTLAHAGAANFPFGQLDRHMGAIKQLCDSGCVATAPPEHVVVVCRRGNDSQVRALRVAEGARLQRTVPAAACSTASCCTRHQFRNARDT